MPPRIARLDDALHDYARERQLPLERSSRKNVAIYTVDGVAVQWADEVEGDDFPRTPVVVHDTVANVRAQFDAVPPTAALIGLIEGLRTSRS